jgi:hypothetical protein
VCIVLCCMTMRMSKFQCTVSVPALPCDHTYVKITALSACQLNPPTCVSPLLAACQPHHVNILSSMRPAAGGLRMSMLETPATLL